MNVNISGEFVFEFFHCGEAQGGEPYPVWMEMLDLFQNRVGNSFVYPSDPMVPFRKDPDRDKKKKKTLIKGRPGKGNFSIAHERQRVNIRKMT